MVVTEEQNHGRLMTKTRVPVFMLMCHASARDVLLLVLILQENESSLRIRGLTGSCLTLTSFKQRAKGSLGCIWP